MRKVIKIAFVVGIALLCMCIYNDSTPSEAIEEVSNYIGDISNKMEGGYDRQYNSRYMYYSISSCYVVWCLYGVLGGVE